jgi:hypothetical protein
MCEGLSSAAAAAAAAAGPGATTQVPAQALWSLQVKGCVLKGVALESRA